MLEERLLVEWRNYSGFLASLGGSCITDLAMVTEDTRLAGLRWIDRVFPETYDETLLGKYMKQSIQL
tara:strand:- start:21 stop:221 length:201 start_codon:yes stop_codon:yes gene_type:complete